MERRAFLAGAGLTGLAATAGCVVGGQPLVGTVDLDDPERGSDGHATYLTYSRDGEELLTVALADRGWGPDGRLNVRLSVWHREDTHLDSVRFELHLLTDPEDLAPAVYLERMGGRPWPEVTFERGQDPGTTVLAADPLGEQGDGTVLFNLEVEPHEEPDSLPIELSFEAVLSGGGIGTYRATDRLERTVRRDNT